MATRKRYLKCADKNCPHENRLKFNDWMREKCPDSNTGFICTDLDFLISHFKKKKFMLLEVKTNMGKLSDSQRQTYVWLHKTINHSRNKEYEYCGIHLIQFEKFCFDDGKCFLDRKEISESDLVLFLSMSV